MEHTDKKYQELLLRICNYCKYNISVYSSNSSENYENFGIDNDAISIKITYSGEKSLAVYSIYENIYFTTDFEEACRRCVEDIISNRRVLFNGIRYSHLNVLPKELESSTVDELMIKLDMVDYEN